MNVLQRKMFAEGDLVNLDIPTDQDIVSKFTTASQLNPVTTTTRIIEQGGTFFAVKQNKNGDVVGSEPIDLGLSPTGDPKEAYQRQKGNVLGNIVGGAGLGLSLLPTLQTKTAGRFLSGIGNLLGKAKGYSPVVATKLPGAVVKGQKGFQSRPKFDPRSYKYEMQTGPASVLGGSALVAGSYGLETDPGEVDDEKAEIAQKLTELENTKTQEEIDNKTKEDDTTFEIVTSEDGTPDDATEIDDGTEQENLIETREVKRQGMLDNPSFKSLLRNIGVSMVETGDVGYGISQGSAQTVKDEMATEALAAETSKEMQLEMLKASLEGVNISDLTSINKMEGEWGELTQQSQDKIGTAGQIKEVLNTLTSQGNKIFGVGNIVTSNFDKIMDFVRGDSILNASKESISEGLKSENPREYVKTILTVVQNKNIKELLGESGRTISNLDRQVVERIVGQLSDTNILSQDPKAIATKLELLYDSLIKEAKQADDMASIIARNLRIAGRDVSKLIPPIPTKTTPVEDQARVRIKIQ